VGGQKGDAPSSYSGMCDSNISIEDCVIDHVWWKGGVEIDRMCRNGTVTFGQSLCFLAHAPELMDSEQCCVRMVEGRGGDR